jgi:Tol biopolymer transport system component
VSVSSSEEQVTSENPLVALSSDGRYVAFTTDSDDLSNRDAPGEIDIFVRDRLSRVTRLVSVAAKGERPNGRSDDPAISRYGRYTAYWSHATNLVPEDTNRAADVFVFDRLQRSTVRVSIGEGGVQGNQSSLGPSLSADGQLVLFSSSATNLTPEGQGGLFVRDVHAGKTSMVSVNSAGEPADQPSFGAEISADGRYAMFLSSASNLVPGDRNMAADVFVRDLRRGTTERVSRLPGDGAAYNPSRVAAISARGRFVVFSKGGLRALEGPSEAGSPPVARVFMRDRHTGAVTVIEGNAGRVTPLGLDLSRGARFVVFDAVGSQVVTGDSNDSYDVYLYDRRTTRTRTVSVGFGGQEADSDSLIPEISGDGRHVAFHSAATNLVRQDTNLSPDIFVRTR